MTFASLFIANRGEIAIRIIGAAGDLGIRTVAVYSQDDDRELHVRRADEAFALRGTGPAAYLDGEQIIAAALDSGCEAIHPGYGFLSERADLAQRCGEAGIRFVGPRPELLDLFGDKAKARELAQRLGVPVVPGISRAVSLDEAREFLGSLGDGGQVVLKAVAGGGGRGIRAVSNPAGLDEAYARSGSEALSAFGNGDVYVERLMPRARHIEVQVLGDGTGSVSHLWERDCSIQRRYQKLVEIAPSPWLAPSLRDELIAAALTMAREVRYDSIGTFEFLVDLDANPETGGYFFIEANPRLQVEHTVTEEITGVDIVKTQLRLAGGCSLAELGLEQHDVPSPRGWAMQVRINSESIDDAGAVKPSAGRLDTFEPAMGPGVRVDSAAYSGYETNPGFDSLLAKLIVHSPTGSFADLAGRAYRALGEFRIEGVATNISPLRALMRHPAFLTGDADTRFIQEHGQELSGDDHRQDTRPSLATVEEAASTAGSGTLAGARVDQRDPLAVLDHGKAIRPRDTATADKVAPPGTIAVRAPMQGTVIAIEVADGELVSAGQSLLVMEAMKMEHVIAAPAGGRVQLAAQVGDTVFEGGQLAFIAEEGESGPVTGQTAAEADLERIRPDLEETNQRHAAGLDQARPAAVARRRKTGQRTARENIEDLCDPGSFVEYGPLVIAAQRRRRSLEDLIENTPADGLVAGIGTVNGELFAQSNARCIAMSYDYTVLAGTQGQQNHRKKDRMFELAEKWRLPIVFFTEGGGGRPGDTDGLGVAGLDCLAFNYFGKLSGLVPLVGIVSGRCFAGNAALLGCCDVVIATQDANIGMGGPAMIEGGGLGVFRPEEVGPVEVQAANGVIDILVEDEAEAVAAAKKYLSYFQGPLAKWACPDQRLLRQAIPENRRRVYDVRSVIETLADTDSVLELRRGFAAGMVTALIRVEGRPIGVIANNPVHLAGAIDSDGADKAARFMQLCDAFDVPILMLCDTPGIMVGPEVEKTALVRHAARMFVTGASVSVPLFTIILRKAYGLGAQAMAGASFKAPFFTVSWPTGEFGGMGLEGAVKLGYRKELAAIEDAAERMAEFEERVERMYEHGKALNAASHFEIDDVIDPMDSRRWITSGLRSQPPPAARTGKKRPSIDTW